MVALAAAMIVARATERGKKREASVHGASEEIRHVETEGYAWPRQGVEDGSGHSGEEIVEGRSEEGVGGPSTDRKGHQTHAPRCDFQS